MSVLKNTRYLFPMTKKKLFHSNHTARYPTQSISPNFFSFLSGQVVFSFSKLINKRIHQMLVSFLNDCELLNSNESLRKLWITIVKITTLERDHLKQKDLYKCEPIFTFRDFDALNCLCFCFNYVIVEMFIEISKSHVTDTKFWFKKK